MNMDYEDRLNIETEFEDLKEESSKNYIELKIKDQSVYWGDNLLLNEGELHRINQVADRLHGYFGLVKDQKKKLCELDVRNVIPKLHVVNTIITNTKNNAAAGSANLASQRIENRKKHNYDSNNNKGNNNLNKKEALMIYTQNREVKANSKILEQLVIFQKSMKELARHYWNCFPANHQRLKKAKIILTHLSEYKNNLQKFQTTLQSKGKAEQKILCQELIDLADKVLKHNKKTEQDVKQKKEKLKQIVNKKQKKIINKNKS